MGIKNVNEIVKDKCERAFVSVKVKSLQNKRLAIDSALWFYANMSVAQTRFVRKMKDILREIDRGELMQFCIQSALRFYTYLLDHDIYGVWIIDGISPQQKKATRAKRQETRESRKDKIAVLRAKLEKQDVLIQNPKDVDDLRKLLLYDVNIYPEENRLFFTVLENLGLPIIMAPGEAEAYACSLNQKGIVYGIWTTDTDCYALGGINMITGFEGVDEYGNEMMSVVHVPYIRKYLGFDEDEMRDFCIMCGTDFNNNITNVGVTRAYNAIEKHRSIDSYSENENKNVDVLNHESSRELLTAPECDLELGSDSLNMDLDKFNKYGSDMNSQYELDTYYNKLAQHMKRNIVITGYKIALGPHNCKAVAKIVINGVPVKKEEEEHEEKKSLLQIQKATVKYDKNITSLEELLANLKT